MNERTIEIYKALYGDLDCSKESLKKYLNVSSVKTVENNIKSIDDIEYDIKIKKYRFKKLLPTYIPNEIFFNIFKESIVNKLLKNDFILLEKDISSLKTKDMINTSELSNLSKKIIMFKNAIKHNCILKVEYKKAGCEIEYKYIQPNTIFCNGFTYYAFVTYDKKNQKDIGKQRTFAFNAIGKIEEDEYLNNVFFEKVQSGNAFGTFKKDKYVVLNLNQQSANFFKREILFNNDAFELIDEELDGDSITVKMFYTSYFEVVKIIQQWMPNIKIQNNLDLRDKVYSDIKINIDKLNKS